MLFAEAEGFEEEGFVAGREGGEGGGGVLELRVLVGARRGDKRVRG